MNKPSFFFFNLPRVEQKEKKQEANSEPWGGGFSEKSTLYFYVKMKS